MIDPAGLDRIRQQIRAALVCKCGHTKREHAGANGGYCIECEAAHSYCPRFQFARYFYAGPWPLRMAAERDRQITSRDQASYLEMVAASKRQQQARTFEERAK